MSPQSAEHRITTSWANPVDGAEHPLWKLQDGWSWRPNQFGSWKRDPFQAENPTATVFIDLSLLRQSPRACHLQESDAASYQWDFQDPKLEVPTIYKAYVREHPHKIRPYMVQYTLHFRILKFPLIISIWDKLIELTKLSIQLVDPSVSQLTAKLSAKSRFKLAKSMSLIVKSTFILCIPIRAGKISILEFWITLVN